MIKYENKDEIIKDLQFFLENKEKFSKHMRHRILDDIIWSWTETDGKVRGCRYWSKEALDKYKENKWSLKNLKFQHEHSIPRKELIKWLNEVPSMEPEKLREILDNYAIGVVVTPETHALLHTEDDVRDWLFIGKEISFQRAMVRYRRANVAVLKVTWGNQREPNCTEEVRLWE